MALTKNPQATTTPVGQFEEMEGDTATVTTETTETQVPPTGTEAAAASDAKTLLAEVKTKAVALTLSKDNVLRKLENMIDIDTLESMTANVFPRITIGLDGFSIDKDKDLGKKIQFEVLSWNRVTLVTAGENDNPEADKMLRSSYDHVNVKSEGMTVADYVQFLKKEHGYENAQAKVYIEVYCNLLWSEDKGAVPADEQKIHQLSLSPTTAARWQGYLLESSVRKARGLPDSSVVYATQEKVLKNNKKWGIGTFSAK